MNEANILDQVFYSIPVDSIIITVPAIPESLIVRLLETIIRSMQINRSVESCLIWIKQILIDFAPLIKGSTANKKVFFITNLLGLKYAIRGLKIN